MLNEQQLSLLDDYINGLLPDEEQKKVKDFINEDANWQKAYVEMLEIEDQLAIGLKTNAFKQVIQQIAIEQSNTNASSSTKGKIISLNWAKASMAAACIIIGLFAINLLFTNPSINPNQLFDDNYTAYANIGNVRGESIEAENIYLNATNYYNNGEYTKALKVFNSIIEQDGFNAKYELYKGICLIETNDFDAATKSFTRIISDGRSAFVNDAKWFKALCNLKNNELNSAKKLFSDVKSSKSVYSNSAENILEELN